MRQMPDIAGRLAVRKIKQFRDGNRGLGERLVSATKSSGLAHRSGCTHSGCKEAPHRCHRLLRSFMTGSTTWLKHGAAPPKRLITVTLTEEDADIYPRLDDEAGGPVDLAPCTCDCSGIQKTGRCNRKAMACLFGRTEGIVLAPYGFTGTSHFGRWTRPRIRCASSDTEARIWFDEWRNSLIRTAVVHQAKCRQPIPILPQHGKRCDPWCAFCTQSPRVRIYRSRTVVLESGGALAMG